MSSRERQKCLDVLGLPHDSSEDDIKKAYRRLAKQYHPDKNTGDDAKEKFQEISYAYKYLIEGPAAVGAEDDDDGIPLDILIRLFPWMFGGPRFHPFNPFFHEDFHHFHHPFYPGMYVDSSDDDDDYYYYGGDPDSGFRPTYTPGPTKEERKKEKKKKARERRKAAKMNKAPPAPGKPSTDTQHSTQTAPDKAGGANGPQHNMNNSSNAPKTTVNAPGSKEEQTQSTPQGKQRTGTENSSAQNAGTGAQQSEKNNSAQNVSSDNQQAQSKKSKKKLKQEQKKREREMETIASEYKQKQKEQAEKEARREEVRKEKEKAEEKRREEERRQELVEEKKREERRKIEEAEKARREEIRKQDEAKREELRKKEEEARRKEEMKMNKSGKGNGNGRNTDSVKGGDDAESWGTVSMSDGETQGMVDDVSDVDDGGVVNSDGFKDQKKSKVAAGFPPQETFERYSTEARTRSYNSTPSVRPKVTHASRSESYHQSRTGNKMEYKDTRSSSRGSDRSLTPNHNHADKTSSMTKKIKRNARRKQLESDSWDEEWSGSEGGLQFDSLMPQSEAEEMRMFHEAILMSEREAKEHGVIPETEEEEQRMLEAALRESQLTAHWGGNMDTLDDVSDGEPGISFGADCGLYGADLRNWHQAVGHKSPTQGNKAGNLRGADSSRGGLTAASNGYGGAVAVDVGAGGAGYFSQQDSKFDKAVGGKVKGKSKSSVKKKASDSWEFGGGKENRPIQTADAQGLQFGLDDFDSVSDDDSYIPEWAREPVAGASSGYNMSASDFASGGFANSQASWEGSGGVKQKHYSSNNSYDFPAQTKSSHYKSSKSSPAGNHDHVRSTNSLADMDDIDDFDTFEDASVPSFGASTEPTSSFDLNIPAAISSKKMKSLYSK